MEALRALARTFAHASLVIDRIRPDQHGLPTPCAQWSVGDLLGHVIGVVTALDAGLNRNRNGADGEPVDTAPAIRFRSAADAGLAGLRRPGGMDAKVDLGPGPMPGEELARFLVLEILVHAWDLAVATGQDPDLPAGLVSLASKVARDMVGPERTGGRFAPPVSVSEDADEATRLLSYLGRRPWPRSPS